MNKKTMITMLLALATLTGQAKVKTIVWENPTIEYGTSNGDGFFNLALDVTKVELKDNETVVYITARQRPGSERDDYWFQFAGDTYLKVGDQRYTLLSADGIELNKHTQTGKDGKRDMTFHFPPLPKGIKVFDFIEGDGEGAFQIKGIKPVEERWKQLLPSYWRDDQTGDWVIAFTEDCAIYDCKFWTYKQCDVNAKTGEAQIVMINDDDELTVTVGKDKKGTRSIQIGNQKKVYSMITSRGLPDYPTKDTRTDFINNGYKTDTITLVGWLKDMPEYYKSLNTFDIGYENFLTDENETVHADLDEHGRFRAKIPVLNSTEFFMDWRRCFINTMLEPGKTYFMLYDFKEGRRYFMGDDCRLQNELFTHIYNWYAQNVSYLREGGRLAEVSKRMDGRNATPVLFDEYIAAMDSMLQVMNAGIDALSEAHPTLSTRFIRYMKGNTRCGMGRDLGQARFNAVQGQLPENARKYAYDTFWTKIEEPVTLYRDMSTFLHDYIDDVSRTFPAKYTFNLQDHIDELASNDEELAILTRWKSWITEAIAAVNAAPTPEEKQKVAEKLNADNADMIKEVEKIMNSPKCAKLISNKNLVTRLKNYRWMLDSLQAVPFIKDFMLSQLVYKEIDNRRTSQSPEVIDTLKTMLSHPEFIVTVEKLNDHYLAIENREFDKLVIKSSDNLADLSEGEALLKKIIEPYKGKFVLLDIWGTWCGPCKEALSHSTEEYARLKDYDIQYLYLANKSPQDSWENVIKEYNVSGPNVAHYNLPAEQQDAIERFLKVHSFPTYKLFNRDGDLLDLKVDARDLNGLARLLESMK
jgi:thiol-disulfide isomerase/thioredoxin